jgi:hypothetical protein
VAREPPRPSATPTEPPVVTERTVLGDHGGDDDDDDQ